MPRHTSTYRPLPLRTLIPDREDTQVNSLDNAGLVNVATNSHDRMTAIIAGMIIVKDQIGPEEFARTFRTTHR